MIYVKKLNIVKYIDEKRLGAFEKAGYAVISEVLPGNEPPADRYLCPHCERDYATAEGLAKHIQSKHGESE